LPRLRPRRGLGQKSRWWFLPLLERLVAPLFRLLFPGPRKAVRSQKKWKKEAKYG
jgi:hypothetical protein